VHTRAHAESGCAQTHAHTNTHTHRYTHAHTHVHMYKKHAGTQSHHTRARTINTQIYMSWHTNSKY